MPRKGWTSVNVNPALFERLGEFADKMDMSIGRIVEEAIEQHALRRQQTQETSKPYLFFEASHCRLRKQTVSANPGHVKKCHSRCFTDTPKLLMKHHSVPGLELWHCPNCDANLLHRIQRE